MLKPVERVINEVMEQRIAALGEPWLSTFDPTHLQRQLLELGFSTAESATPEDLNARYSLGARTGFVREAVYASCARTSDALTRRYGELSLICITAWKRLNHGPILAGAAIGSGLDPMTASAFFDRRNMSRPWVDNRHRILYTARSCRSRLGYATTAFGHPTIASRALFEKRAPLARQLGNRSRL